MSHKQTALDALTYVRDALDGLAADITTSHGVLTLAQTQATVRCAQQEVEAIQELKRPRRIVPANIVHPTAVNPAFPAVFGHDEGGES